jgi:hypothetical protein
LDFSEAKIRLHNHEKAVSFDERSHQYYAGSKNYISTTTLVNHFINIFDYGDHIARRKAEEAGVEVKDIKAQWREKGKVSRERGTVIHNYAEYILNQPGEFENPGFEFPVFIKDLDEYKETLLHNYKLYMSSLHKFINTLDQSNYRLLATETLLHNSKYGVAGQADFILWNEDGSVSIGDWKTNAKISDFSYGKKMRGGLRHLDDSTLNHYKLQLSIYQYFLEQLGFKVKERFLVHLTDNGYKRIDLDYLPAEAEYILKSNRGIYE